MSRLPRKYSYSNVYHVMIRGINKQKIFDEEKDYEKFFQVLQERRQRYRMYLLAYCLMPNHVHLLIYDPEKVMARFMRGIEISYALYFNKKYGRVGNLFQDRFKSKCVDNESYFRTVIRYIHQNPEKALICATEKYIWSSFQMYKMDSVFIDGEKCFELLGYEYLTQKECIKKFIDFNMIKTYNYKEEVECEFERFLPENRAKELMKNTLSEFEIDSVLNLEISTRRRIIRKIKKTECVSNTQIANFFGMKRDTVCKM